VFREDERLGRRWWCVLTFALNEQLPPHGVHSICVFRVQVRAHAAAALQAVGKSRGAYRCSCVGQEQQEGGGGDGFVTVLEAAVEVER
jgi:hypothetical protein